MEIRLGIQHSPREIEDDKGRLVIVPADRLAYAELSTEEPRRVGFLG